MTDLYKGKNISKFSIKWCQIPPLNHQNRGVEMKSLFNFIMMLEILFFI